MTVLRMCVVAYANADLVGCWASSLVFFYISCVAQCVHCFE